MPKAAATLIKEAIDKHDQYICKETLAVKLTTSHIPHCIASTTVEIDGEKLIIELARSENV